MRQKLQHWLWVGIICALGLVPMKIIAVSTSDESPNVQYRGTVVEVRPSTGPDTTLAGYSVRIDAGAHKGEKVEIGVDDQPVSSVGVHVYAVGDRVILDSYQNQSGNTLYVITDYQRQRSLTWLLVLFFVTVVWLSRWRGVRSLIGLGFSYVVMLYWIVPRIAQGHAPVIESIVGCSAILLFSLVITEGISRRTWAALIGMVATMIIIGLLSVWAIRFTHLTGQGGEEELYLKSIIGDNFNLTGLLLAGFIIGTLGILADVGIGQVATVAELNQQHESASKWIIYRRGMRVGLSHLSAIIHTLVLAYAGAALPLLVLFNASGLSFSTNISNELIATEVVRTLVGSIGLVLALPLTTLAAVLLRVQPHGERLSQHNHNSVV